MSKFRASALSIATILMGVHIAVLLSRYRTATASLWGDWIDALTPFAAGVTCWLASRRARAFGKRVWRLVSALVAKVREVLDASSATVPAGD